MDNLLTVSSTNQDEVGKVGEGGDFKITNADFISAIFNQVPIGAFAATCSKPGDPNIGGWPAKSAGQANLPANNNNYVGCSSFKLSEDGSIKARKVQFAACHVMMLDDVGTKIPLEKLSNFETSWRIETSPGNFQVGIIFESPIADGVEAVNLLNALIAGGFCDAGSTGPESRWARLPVAINGKPKYVNEAGEPFHCRLVEWNPEKRYTPQQIIDGFGLKIAPPMPPKYKAKPATENLKIISDDDDVLTPKSAENPVVTALKAIGLYKTPLGAGKHDISCPWAHEHSDGLDTGAAYFEPDETFQIGGFSCMHSHSQKYKIKQLLGHVGISSVVARHKPVIRIVAGDLHKVVDAAEKELANSGRYYQAGGLIVSISTDQITGNPTIVPTSAPALIKELSTIAIWEKHDGRSDGWVSCDPPQRHISILFDGQKFIHLPQLKGLARQPHFRESDGQLITRPGYDKTSQFFGVFDATDFIIPEPTPEAAGKALKLLEELISEFSFVGPADKSAALSAIFTAVVRPTLAHAPAFHVRAPVYASGKTYLCELIGAFAGPGANSKVSYPTTSEEATKVILSLLLTNPAAVEFDDMDGDWLPHGTIKRILTADRITDRILGASKTATVSTRTLLLGSGNNVGPMRDLLRRVSTIHLDPRCSTPATMSYKSAPVEKVRKQRGLYVSAVFTIILAWRMAGSPRADVENIATYGGAWGDYCRHPLMWLGHADPATALLDQVKHDPDADSLAGLMTEWHKIFGSSPATVRKAVEMALSGHPNLLDALREFPIEERGVINRSKLGWFLKKNENRIVKGFEFQKVEADGRNAWRVVLVKTPALPSLPSSSGSAVKTVANPSAIVEIEI